MSYIALNSVHSALQSPTFLFQSHVLSVCLVHSMNRLFNTATTNTPFLVKYTLGLIFTSVVIATTTVLLLLLKTSVFHFLATNYAATNAAIC